MYPQEGSQTSREKGLTIKDIILMFNEIHIQRTEKKLANKVSVATRKDNS